MLNSFFDSIPPAVLNNAMFIVGTLILMLTFKHLMSKK